MHTDEFKSAAASSPRLRASAVKSALINASALALVLTALAIAMMATTALGSDSSPKLPLADVQRLPDVQFAPPSKTGISRSEALDAVARVYNIKELGPTAIADAYLERATVLGSLRGPSPIRDREVWIVRLSGFATEEHGPVTQEGKSSAVYYLRVAYVFLDAATGEHLLSLWLE